MVKFTFAVCCVAVAALFLFCASALQAADQPQPRTISVSANAEIKLPPDFVIVSVQVVTEDREPAKAQAANDPKVREVLAVLAKLGIPDKDIHTGYASLVPRMHYTPEGRQVSDGYAATKQIEITLHELPNYDALIAGVLKAGVNRIDSVTWGSSKEIETRKQARIMAVKAAKDKAQYMAGELGQKVDKPLSIAEERSEPYNVPYQSMNNIGGLLPATAKEKCPQPSLPVPSPSGLA